MCEGLWKQEARPKLIKKVTATTDAAAALPLQETHQQLNAVILHFVSLIFPFDNL
jgi:hypothetical protein